MKTERYIFEGQDTRLDVYLTTVTGYTRSKIKNMIDGGLITVNGSHEKSGKQLRAGDVTEIIIPEITIAGTAEPENIPIDIVYEDDDIVIVNKQAGLTVHPGGGAHSGTLVNALLYRINNLSGAGGSIRPGIVHRLDKDTSGVLAVAKNDYAHVSLAKQIAEKTAVRTYIALLEGTLSEDSGKINRNIIRNPGKRKEFMPCPDNEGRTAVTYYKVIKRYRGYTLTEFILGTGRTHQIRVHARYIGHPVVCDPVYGYKRQKIGHKGQLLHAVSLELNHPVTGERMKFTAPIPDYFTGIVNKLTAEN